MEVLHHKMTTSAFICTSSMGSPKREVTQHLCFQLRAICAIDVSAEVSDLVNEKYLYLSITI